MRRCPQCQLPYHEDVASCLVDGAALVEVDDPLVGAVLGGRYVVEEVLGEGGMATVYRARHGLVERQCAIKVLHAELAKDERLVERLRREARSMAQLAHPNIVQVFDYGSTDDGRPFIVMELLRGNPLSALVARGPMPASRVIALGVQIARGLARAHDFGVIHRDLKPENVIVVEDDEGRPVVKLMDFGIAKVDDDLRLTATGEIIGTPQYMAPDRITGHVETAAADLYSLGVMLFEMITGRLPFVADNVPGFIVAHLHASPPAVQELEPRCPASLAALVAALLEKDPALRPVDAHQVVRVLSELSASGDVAPAPTAPAPGPAPREATVTLDRWQDRVALFEEMVRRAHPRGATPPGVARDLADLRGAVGRLGALRQRGVHLQRELESMEDDAQQNRARLGHAVHVLAVDLSRARESVREAKLALQRGEREVQDLVFQVQALGEQLGRAETEHEARVAAHRERLRDNGEQRRSVEHRLIDVAHRITEPLRDHPEMRDLLEQT